jgi:NAD(P)-dependent dehydrogenase (short-subunit alcohol dehydrogenase family)
LIINKKVMAEYNPFSLAGKTILVTGASSGIGKAIAIECTKMGARVIITGRDRVRLETTYNDLSGHGHIQITADLTVKEELLALVEQLPALDGLVNNAGVSRRLLVKDITAKALESVLNTNFSAPALLTKMLLKAKKINKEASIVFMSSRGADRPTIGNAMYSASKGAINSFAKVMALELAPQNIRVNCILPGMVWTPLIEHSPLSREQYAEDEKRYPLGRYGKPEDIAFTAIFLLSDASVWITGSLITIDGGVSLR